MYILPKIITACRFVGVLRYEVLIVVRFDQSYDFSYVVVKG